MLGEGVYVAYALLSGNDKSHQGVYRNDLGC